MGSVKETKKGDDAMNEESSYNQSGDGGENGKFLKTLAIIVLPLIIYLIIILVPPLQLAPPFEQILGYAAFILFILYLVMVMLLSLWYLFADSSFSEKLAEYFKDSVKFRQNIITRILTIFLPILLVTIAFLSPVIQEIFSPDPNELWTPSVLMSVAIGLLGVYLWTAHMFIEDDIKKIKGEVKNIKKFMDGKTEQIRLKKNWYGRFKAEIENADAIIKVTQHSPISPEDTAVDNWTESYNTLKRKIINDDITVQWIMAGASQEMMDYIKTTIEDIEDNNCQNVVIYGSVPVDKSLISQDSPFPEDLPVARTQSFQIFKNCGEISKGDVVMGIDMGAGRREHLAEGPIYPGDFVTRDVVIMYEFNKYFDSYKSNCLELYSKGKKQEENIDELEGYVEEYVSEDKISSENTQTTVIASDQRR